MGKQCNYGDYSVVMDTEETWLSYTVRRLSVSQVRVVHVMKSLYIVHCVFSSALGHTVTYTTYVDHYTGETSHRMTLMGVFTM